MEYVQYLYKWMDDLSNMFPFSLFMLNLIYLKIRYVFTISLPYFLKGKAGGLGISWRVGEKVV